ncbi:hypothetical protein BFP97_01835 [Roseivirga sp. 4D4]|uniref:hypothetical protein n=1 Tax=Roseivirga sp. 4D4 TaxID=1889784 RepID=UPI0008532F1E|nr:hypothetical protein [Roseivirga sp. 4D4]OEK00328.1 hypothetical protein BFP97_01835 [Roseivirga sp. 4D4]
MRRLSIILISCVTLNLTLWSQLAGTPPNGAVSIGLGDIVSIGSEDWSIFNNPAGLADINEISGIAGYQTILDFSPFNSVFAGINLPSSIGTFGLGASKFGDEIFNTQMLHLALAQKIGIVNLGFKTAIQQLYIDGFGKRSVLVSEIGAITNLGPELTLGTHIYNFTQSNISRDIQEKIPVIVRASIDYHPTDELNLYAEFEKDVRLDPIIKMGLAYRLIETMVLRTGISPTTNRHSFGASLVLKAFTIDYGLRSGQGIGMLHSIGIIYSLKR